MWSRIHLIPMLAAEEDRDQVRRHFADKARERELLGAETKVYHSDRYRFPVLLWRNTQTMLMIQYSFVRPTFAVTPNEVTK
jgi:NADH dehydrogenase (ubiquinone) 1 alpha subcomplex subunit 13